jgi:hypothetical protein
MLKKLSTVETEHLLTTLELRFEQNKHRHPTATWPKVKATLLKNLGKLWSLHEMERTGGEPDLVEMSDKKNECVFFDCAMESPAGRRSFCYDKAGWASRKADRPANNAMDAAALMGIELLNENQYRQLQQFGPFDTKTSSWLATPTSIRQLGGALFGDSRYGSVFIYHNGAQSYYAARGFRGCLTI